MLKSQTLADNDAFSFKKKRPIRTTLAYSGYLKKDVSHSGEMK